MVMQKVRTVMVAVDWREAFAEARRSDGKSENTVLANLRDLAVFERWYAQATGRLFEPGDLDSVTLRMYRQWSLEREQVKPATWNRRLATLQIFVQWAQRMGYLAVFDPLHGVKRKQEEIRPPKWLGRAEVSALLHQVEVAANGENSPARKIAAVQDAALVGLMLFAGLREGEVTALQPGDVQIRDRSGKVVIRAGKGDKFAEIPLSAEARRMVEPYLAMRYEHVRLFDLTTRTIQNRIADLGKQAGVEGLTPHRLRHTFVYRALRQTRSPERVQRLARHANVATTLKYAEPSWEDLAEAVETVLM